MKKNWKKYKIKNIFNITRGNVLSTKELMEYNDNLYPVYSSQTKNNGLLGYYDKFLFENAITWTTDGANAGDVHYRDNKFYCTNVCGVLTGKAMKPNRCISLAIGNVAKRYVSYVGNPKLMNNVMSEIEISLPSVEEQEKIGSFFKELDELIELYEKVYKNVEKVIQSHLEQMYSSNELIELEKYITKYSSKNNKNLKLDIYSITNDKGFVLQKEKFNDRQIASTDTNNYTIVEKNCFGYNPSRIDIGSIGLYTNDNKGIISPLYITFKTVNIPSDYVYWFFKTSHFKKESFKHYEKSVRNTLPWENFKKIYIPIYQEDKFLKNKEILDNLTNLYEELIEFTIRLEDVKKYYLNKIFS